MESRNGVPDKQMAVLVQNGRQHIEALLNTNTPNDAETEVLVAIMAAAHSVLDSDVYSQAVKGTMMGNALRAAFNYGRLQGKAEKTEKKKRPLRPKVRRKK